MCILLVPVRFVVLIWAGRAELDDREGVEDSACERAARTCAEGTCVFALLDTIAFRVSPRAKDLWVVRPVMK